MTLKNYLFKTTLSLFFVINLIFFSTLEAKSLKKFENAEYISDYFSGILLLNDNQYRDSFKFLKKLNGLESFYNPYIDKYLYTLINSGNFNQAVLYAKKIEKENLNTFDSYFIKGLYYLKNGKSNLANEYFIKTKSKISNSIFSSYLIDSLIIWSSIENSNLEKKLTELQRFDSRFENLKKIQRVFMACFYNSEETEVLFDNLVSNNKIDFSRYNYFYANYLIRKGNFEKAKKILKTSLNLHPKNLLLNQLEKNLVDKNFLPNFNCQKQEHVVSEIMYITANAFSSQSMFKLSNFYLNLSRYLNPNFYSYSTLLAENFLRNKDYENSLKIYSKFEDFGEVYEWFSKKQIAKIYILQGKKDNAIRLMTNAFKDLKIKSIYETFDYAEFLKNNEQFDEAINSYTNILSMIDKDHPLYPEVTDGRGVSFERINEWEQAEKDLEASLNSSPNQAYVINYLAYTWIEKGIKIKKSLNMLEKANSLKPNDPYIIDSLGWALYKLKRFEESKEYLQKAVSLMPADPIVNDHFGDVLWKNGQKIQARYYWAYVLNLKDTKKDLKTIIEQKLIKGL